MSVVTWSPGVGLRYGPIMRVHTGVISLVALTMLFVAACTGDGDAPMAAGEAGTGQALVEAKGCVGCHSVDGSKGTGPTFSGLMGSTVEFDDGSSAIADRDYIIESIRKPEARIVKGFGGNMSAYDLSNTEIDQIIAYLETLK